MSPANPQTMTAKAGRPKAKKDDNINIDSLKAEYLTCKTDDYNNSHYYFKIEEKHAKQKFKSLQTIQADNTDLKVPYFTGDGGDVILKVKTKFCPNEEAGELEQGKTYDLKVELSHYAMDKLTPPITGFYAKVKNIAS